MIRIEKKQSNVFNAITCVKNSISKDKTKEYLTVAYFDKEQHNLVATECRKMAVYHLSDDLYNSFIEENASFFTIEKSSSSLLVIPYSNQELQYPNYQLVIPCDEELKGTVKCSSSVRKEKSQYILQKVVVMCNEFINTDLADVIDGERVYNVYHKRAIRLDSDDKELTLVIMPFYKENA